MNKFLIIILLTLFISNQVFSQVGGRESFAFLHLPLSARQVALGGVNITSYNKDVSMFTANPALLSDSTDQYLGVNYYAYYAKIGHSSAMFTTKLRNYGNIGFALQSIGYGDFDGYDATGRATGTFKARDFALTIAYSRQINVFRLGVNMKLAQSSMAEYRSSGLLFDIGGVFVHPEMDLVVGINLKNIGFAFNQFTPTSTYRMPFDTQIGVSYKPSQMPFRFSLTAHHLHQFDIAFEESSSTTPDIFGNQTDNSVSFTTKLFQHFVFGGEFILGKGFNARFGYNYWQRSSLKVEQRTAFTGFSFGFMLRVKKIEVAFSKAAMHLAGSTNSISIVLNMKDLIKRKSTVN